MISRSSFSRLLKEDIKAKTWLVLVNIILFFLNFPVVMAMQVQKVVGYISAGVCTKEEGVDILVDYIGRENTATMLLTLLIACVTAVAQFGYLYQKNQVDFYHSLPIRRQKSFLVRFVNGMLMYALPYILFCMIAIAVVCAFGCGQMTIIRAGFLGFLINIIGYLLCYSTAILAVCLTGNLFTGVCAIVTFQGYGIVAVSLADRMMIECSETYMSKYAKLSELYNFLSPLSAYHKLSDVMDGEGVSHPLLWLFGCLVAGVLLTLISSLTYLHRKSESAGKSIAFEKSKGIIKAFVMVLILGCGTWFFRVMGYNGTFMWSAIGFVITFVLAHILIQIIFEMDVRAIKLGMKSAVVSAIIVIAIFGGFYVGGHYYDSYQINWDQMEYAAIYSDCNQMEYAVIYSMSYNGYTESYYDAEQGRYIDYDEYIFENMKVRDKELIKSITKACIDSRNKQGDMVDVEFKYTLKNGKEIYRAYKIDYNVLKDYILQLLDNKEYRMGAVQIFSIDPEYIYQVEYYDEWSDDQINYLDMTEEETVELIETYKEEYLSATVDELNQNTPIMSLVLDTKYDLITVYIYPTFERTIALLESKGVKAKTMDEADFTKITVSWWNDLEDGVMEPVEVTYTEPEKIRELRETLCYAEYGYHTAFDCDYALKRDYTIVLELEDKDGGILQKNAVFIKAIPEWLQEDLKNTEIRQEIEETAQ